MVPRGRPVRRPRWRTLPPGMRDTTFPQVTVPAFLAALRAGTLPEGPRAELHGGRVVPGYTPSPTEMAMLANLHAALGARDIVAAGCQVHVNPAFRMGPGDLLRADLALLVTAGGAPVPGSTGRAVAGVGGSFDPDAALLIVELARGRAARVDRVALYGAAGARELWLLDTARGWTEVLRSPWRGVYRSRTLWYPGEAIRLAALSGPEVVAMPAP